VLPSLPARPPLPCTVLRSSLLGRDRLDSLNQRLVLFRADPIVICMFCVAFTHCVDESKLPHDQVFGVDCIFKGKRVRSIVVCIVNSMSDPVPCISICTVFKLHEPPPNFTFFFSHYARWWTMCSLLALYALNPLDTQSIFSHP
jgi:hypothetical protein